MKTCTKCGEEKDDSCFSFKNKAKGIRAFECKSCHVIMRKTHYNNNKQTEVDRIVKRRNEIRNWYNDYKALLKCERCGEDHIATLQFHHTNPKEKEFTISVMINYGYSIKRILKEVDKCIVLCANCHSKEHYNSAGIV